MEQSRLIELILSLNLIEREQLLQFAALPMFNKGRMRTHVAPFLQICINFPWHDNEKPLNKQNAYKILFPNSKFTEGKIDKIMVEAYKVTRDYLLAKQYFNPDNEFYQLYDFTKILYQKGLGSRVPNSFSKLTSYQNERLWKDSPYLHCQYLLENAIHQECSMNNQVKGDLNISNTISYISQYYLLIQLELSNRLLLQQKIAHVNINLKTKILIEKIPVPIEYFNELPIIQINYQINCLLKKETLEPSDISSTYSLLILHEQNLSPESLQEAYTYLRNICFLFISNNPEREETYITLHDLYANGLTRGHLLYEGKITPSRYFAVCNNALNVKKNDWALNFIESYKNKIIGENENKDIYRLNLANYFFEKGQFLSCLENIPPAPHYVDYLLHAKRIELKALYELQSDLLNYKLDAFKMFLSRTSQKLLAEKARQTHINFANLLTQIIASIPGDKKRSVVLLKRLEEKKQAADWRWLLEKAKKIGEIR